MKCLMLILSFFPTCLPLRFFGFLRIFTLSYIMITLLRFFHLFVIVFRPLDEKYTQTNHLLLLLMFCLLDCEMFCRILHEKLVWRLYGCHKMCTSGWLLVRKMRIPGLQIIYTHRIFFWHTNQQKQIHNNQNNKISTLIEDFFSVFFISSVYSDVNESYRNNTWFYVFCIFFLNPSLADGQWQQRPLITVIYFMSWSRHSRSIIICVIGF